jgi:dienelactone hydrolase
MAAMLPDTPPGKQPAPPGETCDCYCGSDKMQCRYCNFLPENTEADMKKILKKTALITAAVLSVLIALLLGWKWHADAHYFDDYDPLLSFNEYAEGGDTVQDVQKVFGVERPRHFYRYKVYIESRPGEKIPVLMTFPADYEGQLPVILFLHGIGQKKEFLNDISGPFNQAGFAMACFDQSMQGERKVEGSLLQQAASFRQRPWKTINDARRTIDYLQNHPDIDPERIYLVGASYGAITGTTVVAFEDRIRAAVLAVGGGNIPIMLQAPIIDEHALEYVSPWQLKLAKAVVSFIMKPADPINYAKDTSPTPVLMLNGDRDQLVTPEAGRELYNALGEPREIRWYPINHPGIDKSDGPTIIELLDDALDWLVEQDAPFREDEAEENNNDTIITEKTRITRDSAA